MDAAPHPLLDSQRWQLLRQQLPDVPLSRDQFEAHLRRHGPALPLHLEDLYLALGASRGAPSALDRFEAHALHPARALLAERFGAAAADDALQATRAHLFAHPSGRSPLLDYSGRGSLRGYVSAVALRMAFAAHRKEKGGQDPASLGSLDETELPRVEADLELALARQQHLGDFRSAFTAAFAELAPRDRLMLQLSIVDGLSIDEIGRLHQIHRSSAARWVAQARSSLRKRTLDLLRARLRLGPASASSLVRLCRSEVDLSLRSLFSPGPAR